jgi:hypothetical protein
MAESLRENIPSDDVLLIQDVNKDDVRKFIDELSGFNVNPAENTREIVETSVHLNHLLSCRCTFQTYVRGGRKKRTCRSSPAD